jgi:hypothetical protein
LPYRTCHVHPIIDPPPSLAAWGATLDKAVLKGIMHNRAG